MRWLVVFLYCAVIGAIDYLILQRKAAPSEPGAVAAHDLPANWRIESGDLQATRSLGRYTLRRLEAGALIAAGDLAAQPRLAPETGALLVTLPLPTSAGVNAGSRVILCQAGAQLGEPLVVRAKTCVAGMSCNIVVSVPNARLASVGAIKPAPPAEARLAGTGCGT